MLLVKAIVSAGKGGVSNVKRLGNLYCENDCVKDNVDQYRDLVSKSTSASTSASSSSSGGGGEDSSINNFSSFSRSGSSSSSSSDDSDSYKTHITRSATLIPLGDIERVLTHQNNHYARKKKYRSPRQHGRKGHGHGHGSGNVNGSNYYNTDASSVGVISRGDSDMFSADTQLHGNRNKYSDIRPPTPRQKGGKLDLKLDRKLVRDKYHIDGEDDNDNDNDDQSRATHFSYISNNSSQCQSQSNNSSSGSSSHHKDILELKTKAFMPDYYMDSWIMMFPSYHVPTGVSKMSYQMNRKNNSGLLPISSSSMSSLSSNSPNRKSTPPSSPSSSSSKSSSSSSSSSSSPLPSPSFTKQNSENHLRKEMFQYGNAVQLIADNSTCLDLVLLGSLGLVQDRQRYPTRTTVRGYKSYIVLGDRSTGKIVALCSLKSTRGRPVVRIFGTVPRSSRQVAATDTLSLGLTKHDDGHHESNDNSNNTNNTCNANANVPLYAWAEFRYEGQFPNMKSTKYMLYPSTGRREGEFYATPMFVAVHKFPATSELLEVSQLKPTGTTIMTDAASPGNISRNISGSGRRRKKNMNMRMAWKKEVCASVSIRTSTKWCEEETYYALSISKDVDVASVVCFTAIIDEVMEFTMKKQCANEAVRHPQSKSISRSNSGRRFWT